MCVEPYLRNEKLKRDSVMSDIDEKIISKKVAIAEFEHDGDGYRVDLVSPNDSQYADVLEIRSQGRSDRVCTDKYDDVAFIYLLSGNGVPIATMRFNQARRGEVDCEDYYPIEGFNRFRNVIGSCSRLARSIHVAPNVPLLKKFLMLVQRHQILDGMFIEFINVTQKMIPYYAMFGYKMVCNSNFTHPRLGTQSYVMCFYASGDALAIELMGLQLVCAIDEYISSLICNYKCINCPVNISC